MDGKKLALKPAKQSKEATQQVLETALWSIFSSGDTKIKGESAAADETSYRFIETDFTKVAEKCTMGKIFGCSFERWTQPAMFMNAFKRKHIVIVTLYALSPQLEAQMQEQDSRQMALKGQSKGFLQSNSALIKGLPPSPFFSSDEIDCKKHCKSRHKNSASKTKDLQLKSKIPYSTANFEKGTRTTLSEHNSPISNFSSKPQNRVV